MIHESARYLLNDQSRAVSARSCRRHGFGPSVRPGRHGTALPGFTLIELLIVIGILVALTGLLLAGLIRSKRIANVIRVKADLGMIDTAIAAYKDEFGDIPRFID